MTLTNWEQFLDLRFCRADEETGNRPCDDGQPCRACDQEAATYDYIDWKIRTGRKDDHETMMEDDLND